MFVNQIFASISLKVLQRDQKLGRQQPHLPQWRYAYGRTVYKYEQYIYTYL